MSSTIPMPDPDTFNWADVPDWGNTLQYEHEHEHEQIPDQIQNGAQHGTAFDTFDPRHQHGEIDSWTHPPVRSLPTNNQYVDSFNLEHLTPDPSVANEHDHTEVDDLLWPHQAGNIDQDAYRNPALQHTAVVNNAADLHSVGSQLKQAQLLPSPELTATSTPETSWHAKTLSGSTSGINPLTPSSQPPKRQFTDLDSSMSHADSGRLAQPKSQPYHSISPVIHVSSHSRGDSPARSYFANSNIGQRMGSPARQRISSRDPSPMCRPSTLQPPHYQDLEDDDEADDDADDLERDRNVRTGVQPGARTTEVTPSFDDIEKQEELESTISHVRSWLADTSLSAPRARTPRTKVDPNRARSRSTGARAVPSQAGNLQQRRVPGPGVLLDEDSEYYYSTDSDEGSLDSDQYGPTEPAPRPQSDIDGDSLSGNDDTIVPDNEPSPRQFFRKQPPWQDPPRGPEKSTRAQPETANAAMYRFEQRAKNFETASRAATWGTGRRTSTAGVGSIMDDHKTRHQSLSQRTRERGQSFINEARNMARELMPRRSNSNLKKHGPHAYAGVEKAMSPDSIEHGDPIEHAKSMSPRHSLNKARSHQLHTGDALIAMSAGIAAVGSSVPAEMETSHNPLKRALNRVRSNSEVPKSPKRPTRLTGLIAQQGGMPVPALASPSHELDPLADDASVPQAIVQDELTVKMELPVEQAHIIPTLDGFKHEIVRLNPRLDAFLVDRIAHDQLRRYKRLIKNKVDHKKAVAEGTCASRHQCVATGAVAEILAARGTARDAPSNSQFKIETTIENDEELDESNFDGIVTPALFPDGIPPPPTTRLPARFECPLCFQVKSFSKPSDWTKHVHEDVQPFTCTFPQCPDPKSFKRKADWVRHENERHRHLEWWRCNLHECQHVCYRKDNFVQHLVREHKKKEPKLKGRNPNMKGKGRIAGNQFTQEEREFWLLVDECRHESSASPRNEPCRFCGNCLNSWKKLSVHVGKHMEQIAMPVLELAEKKNVTKDTIISPIEAYANRQQTFSLDQQTAKADPSGASPYYSGTSNYQSSSAGPSPSLMPQRPNAGQRSTSQQYLDANYASAMNHMNLGSGSYSSNIAYTANPGYGNFTAYADPNHMPYDGQTYPVQQMSTSSSYSMPPNRSMDTSYVGTPMQGNMPGGIYQTHQYFASPEMQQATYVGYDQSVMHGNMTDNVPMQPVVTTSQGMNNSYAYNDPHGGSSGHEYYSN